MAERGLGRCALGCRRPVHGPITAHAVPSGAAVILPGMDTFACHDCREPVPDDLVAWLSPSDRRPDEDAGEPFCPGCAAPLPLAA